MKKGVVGFTPYANADYSLRLNPKAEYSSVLRINDTTVYSPIRSKDELVFYAANQFRSSHCNTSFLTVTESRLAFV